MAPMNDWGELAASLGWSADAAELEACLRTMYDAGRARFAALPPLEAADFVAHLALHTPPDGDRIAHLKSLVAEDLYLACACLTEVPGAIEAFDAQYLTRVSGFIAHIDNSPAFADELRQQLRESLLVRRQDRAAPIADYSGRGAMMVWVRISAVRAALRHRRRPEEQRRSDDPAALDELAIEASPELQLLRQRHAATLEQALKKAISALPSEQRVILRMYFSSGQNTARIATIMRVDRSTAARRLVAAREAVFDETKRLMQQELKLTTDEFASLARVLHDQLNVSIGSLLAESQ
jgi:RNA polymerase sigma-70 factor (ECF subfamily)